MKTRVDGLTPGTQYFLSLQLQPGVAFRATTRIGRTKTAPDADADVERALRGGLVPRLPRQVTPRLSQACHTFDLDVIVHLGDYVYETTADPTFQVRGPGTPVMLQSARNEALDLGRLPVQPRNHLITTGICIGCIARIPIYRRSTSASR